MSEEYRKAMRKLTDLRSRVLDRIVRELFSQEYTDEQRNRILHTAIALVNRSAASQLLQASLLILRSNPEALDMWCNIGREIGLTSIIASKEYFRRSPDVLKDIRMEELGSWASLGIRIARKSHNAAVEYFRASPNLLTTLRLSDLIRWGEEGYRILGERKPSSEKAAIEYFALATRRSFDLMRSGPAAHLEEYSRVLKLYAEAISGREIQIRPLADSFRTDGETIYLPVSLNAYEDKELNFRLYRALTARLLGRIVYGSFDLDLRKIETQAREIAARYGSKIDTRGGGVEALFQLYSNPLLAREVFEMLEDTRVERRLRGEYRGVGKDLDLIKHALYRRSKLEEMPPLQAVLQVLLETLLLGATPGDTPSWISKKVQECISICKTAGDDVEDTALAADRIYCVLESVPGLKYGLPPTPKEKEEIGGLGLGKRGRAWRPRGDVIERMGSRLPRRTRTFTMLKRLLSAISRKAEIKKMPKLRGAKPIEPRKKSGEAMFRYDEWDYKLSDYRKGWCTVRETTVRPGSVRFADKTLASHSGLISAVKREFQMFKPERLRKEKKQTDGDEIDIDAAVESFAELKAGTPVIEGRVYTRRNKIQRDVSAVFLVDLSGSTAGWIIGTEKKALVIMCEALEAIGDRYAIYGFSGATRDNVEFYVVKDFEERYDHTVKGRISKMMSLSQNRDGAAIRHAANRLENSESKTKLLIVVSDGHPLDQIPRPGDPLYDGEYSIQDTRMALKEAKMRGIRPFCITVDKKAEDYVSRMYADVNYTIIDNVAKLPERMPAIYRRLTT